jgi:Poxvirus Late Transcription Factor VLTF3 like
MTDSKRKPQVPSTSMDILDLNSRVQKFIDEETIKIDGLKNLNDTLGQLINGDYHLRPRMIYKLNVEKENVTTKVNEYENLKYFKIDVAPVIEKYHSLNQQTMVIPFFSSSMNQTKEHLRKKEETQHEFTQKLKEYSNLRNFAQHTRISVSKSSPPPCTCGNKKEFIKDEDRAVCALCSTEQALICNVSSFSDVGRVNMTNKYTYNRKIHFRDCIVQYQGKQKTNVPEEIYTVLEKKLVESGAITKEVTDKLKRYENVTRSTVLDILKSMKIVKKFYDDIVLIHHNLTGQPCDDISGLEDSLLSDFDMLTNAYDKMYEVSDKSDDGNDTTKRKNFINAQFVLYQLLMKNGHKCREMDFLTLKTSERKRFHHDICKELFRVLNWNYSYSI